LTRNPSHKETDSTTLAPAPAIQAEGSQTIASAPQQSSAGTIEPTSNPITAFDVLSQIEEIGIHWWSVIDDTLETHHARYAASPGS